MEAEEIQKHFEITEAESVEILNRRFEEENLERLKAYNKSN